MHRGDDPFGVAPFSVRRPVDMGVTAQAFTARLGLANTIRLLNEGHRAAVHRTLDEAGWELSTVDRFVLPNLGRRRLDINYLRLFGIPLERTTWSWGRRIGHMGAADQFAGLEHLLVSGELAAGQRCLVLGCGAGFTWSGAAVEILETPQWNGGRSVA
jgi:3-oxoacyl-[acyl-carrier-protein] synthase-3